MSTRMFGARIERNVDPKLLRGEGAFVDDIPLPGALHVAFLRSPHARARINSIDAAAARKVALLTMTSSATVLFGSNRCRVTVRGLR